MIDRTEGQSAAVSIMLLEDNPGDVRFVREALSDSSLDVHQLDHFETLSEALQALGSRTYDAVIVDLALPDSVGIDTFRAVAQACPASAIVILSGSEGDQVAVQAVALGAQDYLPKSHVDAVTLQRVLRYSIERKHLEQNLLRRTEELDRARREADMANRAKSVFLANMSHEIRTPMNAILGFAELMQADPVLSDDHRNYIQTISRSGAHLMRLLDGILQMSKIEAGREDVEKTRVDIYSLAKDVVEIFRPMARQKNLELDLQWFQSSPSTVETDADKLREILHNLISNAIKYTQTGSVKLSVTADRMSRELAMDVADTGPGMTEAEMQRVFAPFEQLSNREAENAGTGLGLSISRRLAALLGGALTVRSTVGEGSRFRLRLPFNPNHDVREEAQEIAGLARIEEQSRQPMVLVVDDLDDTRSLFVTALRRGGFDTLSASSAYDALEILESTVPEACVIDLRMPVMDGFELAEEIRRRSLDDTMLFAVSASAFHDVREKALACGFDEYIAKPASPDDLIRRVARALGIAVVEPDSIGEEVGIATVTEELERLDEEHRMALLSAALAADSELLLSLCSRLATRAPNAVAALVKHAQDYRYREIRQLLKAEDTVDKE